MAGGRDSSTRYTKLLGNKNSMCLLSFYHRYDCMHDDPEAEHAQRANARCQQLQ